MNHLKRSLCLPLLLVSLWGASTPPPAFRTQILVPAGTYALGCPAAPGEAASLRTVTLAAFLIDAHPVTNQQYSEFLQASGCQPQGPFDRTGAQKQPFQPAVSLTRADCQAYATFQKRQLPSADQWEAAAMLDPAPPANANHYYDIHYSLAVLDVFSFPPDRAGLVGMGTNIYEWTRDDATPRRIQGRNVPPTPLAILKGAAVTLRADDAAPCRAIPFLADRTLRWLGFRCVTPLPPTDKRP